MSKRHLTDDQLVELCLGHERTGQTAAATAHLVGCPDCEVRRVSLAEMLTDVSTVAAAEADAAFPPDRLSRQQARILQRIEQDGRPGRLISFPAMTSAAPIFQRAHRTTRWIAGAAAAAFVIGVLAGHLATDFPGQRMARVSPSASARPSARPAAAPLRTAAMPSSDEEFLYEIEAAAGSAGPAMLRRIDALTPRAWETR
jgi:hypothetical protein